MIPFIQKNKNTILLYGGLCVFLLFVIITVFFLVERTTEQDNLQRDNGSTANTVVTPISQTSDEITAAEPVIQSLTGTLIKISDDKSYIRVSINEIGIVSVGISTTTKLTADGIESSLEKVSPMSEVTVEAIELPSTGTYDFLAYSIEFRNSDPFAHPDLSTPEKQEDFFRKMPVFEM